MDQAELLKQQNELLRQLPDAPHWALFVGSLGSFLIDAGILFFLASILLWIFQAKRPALSKWASISFFGGTLSILGAMASLVCLFVGDQFEFRYIALHSAVDIATYYKVASVWSAQEGSFLLWATTSAIFGMLAFRGTQQYKRWYCVAYSVFLGCLCGILAYETPFDLLRDASVNGVIKMPHTGSGMTPALQNYWVVIHPPTIFMGFGCLTVMFAMSVSAMLTGNVVDWVKIARPWTLISIGVVGVGLCMGGLWAYETLGWGGFWQWDPVENVSFVPWLFAVALAHGIIVQVTKKRWIGANLILGGLPFLTYTYGTFLTRSGLLDKVSNHSFAEMDHSALIVLVSFLAAVTVAFGVLYGVRGAKLSKLPELKQPEQGIDREAMYRVGVILLSLMAVGITIGMSWPWFTALRSGEGSAIREPQYHMVVVWFFIPIMLLMGAAPFITWRPMSGKAIFDRLIMVLSITAGSTGFALVAMENPTIGVHMAPGETVWMPFRTRMLLMPWMAILTFVCFFAIIANLWRIAEIVRRSKLTLGGFVAHIGVAVLMTGLILSRGFEQTDVANVDPALGATNILGYSIEYDKTVRKDMQDRDGKVLFKVTDPSGHVFEADPGLYYFPGDKGEPKAMVWPYILKGLSHDFYMSMAEPDIYAWDKPVNFKQGETKTIPIGDPDKPMDVMTVTYKHFTREGQVGTVGTKFGAVVHIEDKLGSYDINPTFQVTADGAPKREMPAIGALFRMAMINMDASDDSVNLQALFSPPLYPIQIFYKPMTILVWLGAGIVFIGGMMSAYARRVVRRSPSGPMPASESETSLDGDPAAESESNTDDLAEPEA